MRATETERLNFLIDRDGMEGALDFAKRTMVSYRRHALDRKRNRFDRALITPFVLRYLAFKQFVQENA